MSKSKIVVLSDIHIGTNVPTVWYQKVIHEPYLVTVLDWIIQNASSIRELILLGDVVDFWTYPPDEEPPTFDAIMAANPKLFGPNGKLSEVLTALDGKVTYVRGNHDMTITQEDLDKIKNSKGYKIQLSPEDIYYPLGNSNKKIACTHGHIYTMFNAPYMPDAIMHPIAPLPLGQFITRCVAFMRSQGLEPGQTVAQLKDSGDPDNTQLLSSALPQLIKVIDNPNLPIVNIIIDTISDVTGMKQTQRIQLGNGKETTLEKAKEIYSNLWDEWQKKHGKSNAIKSILADIALSDGFLGWFAQKLAQDVGAELIVMGHTHKPISDMSYSTIKYVNTGFNCPSAVDLGKKNATFVQIDMGDYQAQILQVIQENGSYNIKDCPVQTLDNNKHIKIGDYEIQLNFDPNTAVDIVVNKLINSDKKFVIEVVNKTKYELQCVGAKNNSGQWNLVDIPANTSISKEIDYHSVTNTFSLGANYRLKGGIGFIQLAGSWPLGGSRKIGVGSINQDGDAPAGKVWADTNDALDKYCSNNYVEVRAFIKSKEKGKTIIWFYEVTER
jgi:predicted phosphodiesterase